MKESLPSDGLESEQVVDVCRALEPYDFSFTHVQVNRFTKAKQCQLHADPYNVGHSLWAMMGPALRERCC